MSSRAKGSRCSRIKRWRVAIQSRIKNLDRGALQELRFFELVLRRVGGNIKVQRRSDSDDNFCSLLSESRGNEEKHMGQHFDHELKNMTSSLTNMGAEKGKSSQYEEKEEDEGVRVITLSGSNIGATMKTELDNNHGDNIHELDFLTTFVNSNFQAVNNSLMIGAKYETHDPGVHLDISGDVEKPSTMKASERESKETKGKTPARSGR